jgi:RHS repeat-associated protein
MARRLEGYVRRSLITLLVAVSVMLSTGTGSARADELEQGLQLKFRQARVLLVQAGARLRKGESPAAEIEQAKKLSEEVRADSMLMVERFRLREEKAAQLGGSAVARQNAVTAGYTRAIEEYLALIAAIPPDGNVTPTVLESLDKLLDYLIPKKKLPLFGNLPYRHLSFPPKEPDISTVVVPAYRGGDSTVTSRDTASTPEAPLSPEIGELAKNLNFSPVLIYEWVKNNVETEWYWGCMKGAEETLRQKGGNDCDQAALLTALLRVSGFPTRYVHGVMEFFPDIEKAKNLTGVDDPGKLARFFQRAGIPYKPVIAGGGIANIQLEHIWVESQVPYSNYRGAVIDNTGKTWVALDTHIKASGYTWKRPQALPAGLSPDSFRDEYLSAPRSETPLEFIRAGIGAYLASNRPEATYQQFLRTRTLNPEVLNILPAGLQFRPVSITAEHTEIPANLRQTVRFTASDRTRELFSLTLDAHRLAGKKTVLTYEPESVEDQMLIDSYGGLDNTPAYLVRLRPVLKVDDERLVVGKDGLPVGADYTLAIDAITPNGIATSSSSQITGNLSAILVAAQRTPPEAKPEAGDSAETLLYKEAGNYINRWSRAEDELASLLGISLSRPVPIVVTVGNLVDVTWLGDTPHEIRWKGVFLDANLRGVEAVAANGAADEKTFMRLSGLEGSILENRVFEDDFQAESVSTAKLFQAANGRGLPFKTIDRTNLDSILPGLPVDEAVKTDIRNAALQGLTIRIPEVELTIRNWSGAGYIKENPETGEAGWMLSGMVAGGMSAISADAWNAIFKDSLSAAFSEPPNRDPESGVSIAKITATDLQFGLVGEALTTPLQVMVKDGSGKPVAKATVTFTIRAGGGAFDNGAPVVTVKTGDSGIASAKLVLGQKTGDNPAFFTEKEDTYSRQYGANIVDAALSSGTALTAPFTLYGMPGKVDRIRKLYGDGVSSSILSFAGFVSLAVEDVYGNPVANQPVVFTAEAAIDKAGCANPNQDTRPAMLVRAGDSCLNRVLTYTGLGQCSTAALSVTEYSAANGSLMQIVLGSVPGADYPVTATVKADAGKTLSETFTLKTYPFGNCSGGSAPSQRLVTTYIFPADENGNSINAAKAGSSLPVEGRIYFIKEGEKETTETLSCDPPITCKKIVGARTYADTTDFKSSSVTFNGVAGAAQGEGRFTTAWQLNPGLNEITITGKAGIAVKETRNTCSGCSGILDSTVSGESSTVMKVYGVAIAAGVSGDVIVNAKGYSQNDVTITYGISPAQYKALSATVFIYKGGEVVAAIPSETSGSGFAVVARGFKFAADAPYSAQIVLNFGSGAEIRSDKVPINLHGPMFGLQRVHMASKFGPPVPDTGESFTDSYKTFEFSLEQATPVSVTLLDNDSNERGTLISEATLSAGEHRFVVNYAQVLKAGFNPATSPGFSIRINYGAAPDMPARSTFHRGKMSERVDGKMLGQTMVHDVLIQDGSLNLSREDFAFTGRGPQLAFGRSYTNQSSPAEYQYLGEGWSHSLDYKLRPMGRQDSGNGSLPDWVKNMEGRFFLPGDVAEGGIQWTSVSINQGVFRKHNGVWYADRGRHGRLVESAEGFVFTAKDGTRYVYDYPSSREPVSVRYIEDKNGNRMTFTYNGTKQLERVTDAVGRSCVFGYINLPGAVTSSSTRLGSVSCPDGVELAFSYNDQGYLKEAKRGARSEKYDYAPEQGIAGADYNLVKTSDSNNHGFSYQYHLLGELPPNMGTFVKALRAQDVVKRVEYPDAKSALFFYDTASGNKRTVRDLRGNDTLYTLNYVGNPLRIDEPLGKTTLMTWSIDEGKPDNVMTSRTDGRQFITLYEYDLQGNITKETDPYSKSIISTWNQAFSLIESRTDRNNIKQTWQYDPRGNLLLHTDGDLKNHSYSYNSFGEMESSTDPRQFRTAYTWDQYGNPASETGPEGSLTQYKHDIRGRRIELTDPNHRTTVFNYDNLDHPTTTVYPPFNSYTLASGSTNIKTTVHDAEGNLKTETDRTGLTLTYTYTPRDQVKTITRNIGGEKTFDYDGNGNLTSESDWKGVATIHHYDELNRRDSTTNRLGHTTLMGYDLNGNPTSTTDAEGRVTTHEYDKLNRLTDTWQPALEGQPRGRLRYTYYDEADPKTNLKSETDQEEHTTSYTYNGRYLRTGRIDAKLNPHTWDYDDNGNLRLETDEEGRVTRNEYDKQNRLTDVYRKLDGLDIVTRYQYDPAGNRTHVVDPNTHVTETIYDEWNRPWKTIDPDKYTTVTELDGEGREVKSVDGNLVERRKLRDQRGLVLTATDGEEKDTGYSYDANGNTETITDAKQVVTRITYDAEDRKLLTTEAEGLPEQRTTGVVLYDKVGNPKEVRDGNGNIRKTDYNALNLPWRVYDPAPFNANYTETDYYKTGKVRTIKDRRGYLTSHEYDELNRLTRVTDPLTRTVETGYDKVGNVKTAKDKRNIITESDYNELNLLKEKRRANLRLVTNEYDGNGNLRYVTDARGYRIEQRYNKRNLLETTVYPASESLPETTEQKTYDGARNLKTVTDEEQKTTSYTYDRENRQTSIELAGERTWNRYDDVGNLRETEKPERNTRTMEHDGLKRLTSVTEGGLTTRFEYDANGNQRHQYDARQNHVEITWDELNRKKEHIRHKGDGNLVTRFVEYDAEGNLKKLIDPKEQEFSYDYDELNRQTDEHLPAAATPYLTLVKVHTEYDGNNNETAVTETKTDTGGATITDTTTNTYDDFDRLKTSETRGITVGYDYDNNGNRTQVSTPSGSTSYTYHPRNWVKTATAGGTTGFDYYPDGKQKTISYPNGAAITYTYHPTDRVKTVSNTGAGNSVISGFSYEYDHNGNRTRQEETRNGITETTGYRYDTLDRMESYTVTRGADTTTSDYTFDGYNRKTETIRENGTQTVTRSYDYDETDWLTSVQVTDHGAAKTISYLYDKNGNTLRKTDSSETDLILYDYNSSNQLVKAMKGATLLGLYDYNSDGLRIRHRNGDRGDVDYWYDGKAVIEERKNGGLLAHYRYAGRPLSLLTGGTSQYYHFDALGSTVNLSNASGNQQAGYFLDPWGHVKEKEGESVNRQIFTGQEHDEKTGLIYFGARYYDPDTARFMTEDSYLGEKGTPPSLNRYLYAYSNPTVYIDLEGYDAVNINGTKAAWEVQKDWPGPINPRVNQFEIGKAPREQHILRKTDQPYVYLTEEFGGGKVRSKDLQRAADSFLWDVGDISRYTTKQQKEIVRSYIDTRLNPRGERREKSVKNILSDNFKEATVGLPKNVCLDLKAANRDIKENPDKVILFLLMGELSATQVGAAKIPTPNSKGGMPVNANYSQSKINRAETFSERGQEIYKKLAGEPIHTVDDLANAIKSGKVNQKDIIVDYVIRDGQPLIHNTRTSQALERAGIPRSEWNARNMTGNVVVENRVTGQLDRSGLPPSGTTQLKRRK